MITRTFVPDRFANKVAIVTGGSSGIGRAIVEELCKEGARVAFSGISDIGLTTARELQDAGFDVLFVQGDMSQGTFCKALVDETLARWGKVNYLVNNAFSFTAKGLDATREDWERIFFAGPVAYATMGQLVCQPMAGQGGGSIVNMSSISAFITQIIISSHLGTHADAPFHFFDDGLTIDQIDVLRGFGPAEVLDLRHKAPQSIITVEDLQAFGDRIRPGCRLIFRTDWDKQFPQPHYFGDQPRLHVETCEWMVQQGVRCIAMDLPTTNPPEYTPTHHALLNARARVLIIEGLRGIDRLQSQQVILMALPLRLRGRDGAQCRAMAIDGDIGPLVPFFDLLVFDAAY